MWQLTSREIGEVAGKSKPLYTRYMRCLRYVGVFTV